MLSIVLVTPTYAECATPAGLYTRALAHHYASCGHRVRVLCASAWAPRPAFEIDRGVRVHRLSCRRANLSASFACAAARRVRETIDTSAVDVLIDIDSPPFRVMHAANEADSIRADVNRSISIAQLAQAHPEEFPPLGGQWSPPRLAVSSVLAIPDSPSHRDEIVQAYLESDAPRTGWSLRIMEPDASWTTLVPAASTEHTDEQIGTDAVLLTPAPSHTILGLMASEHGIPQLLPAPDLSERISRLITMPADRRRGIAREIWDIAHRPATVEARRAHFASMLTQNSPSPIDAWRRIEYAGESMSVGGDA